MLRRLRRPAAALTAVLLVPALAACGSDDSGKADDTASKAETSAASSPAPEAGELDEVTFEGEVGESLEATWNAEVAKPDETTVTTLVKGDGEAVAEGDTVSLYLYIGNGTSQQDVYSDYEQGQPEAIPNDGQLGDVFTQLLTGQTYGSRVAAVTTAAELFGASASQTGINADDSLVVVGDLIEKQEEAPTPTDDTAQDADPSAQPTIVEKDGKPTGLDFSGIDEPALDTPVQRLVLKEGDGAEVKAADTITVNYLGSVYDADAPFDESFSGEPLNSPLSGLIPGWSIGLEGVKVGSRVLLQIPPAFGYGAQGSGSGIPGNATLWFVIDVVKAEAGS